MKLRDHHGNSNHYNDCIRQGNCQPDTTNSHTTNHRQKHTKRNKQNNLTEQNQPCRLIRLTQRLEQCHSDHETSLQNICTEHNAWLPSTGRHTPGVVVNMDNISGTVPPECRISKIILSLQLQKPLSVSLPYHNPLHRNLCLPPAENLG